VSKADEVIYDILLSTYHTTSLSLQRVRKKPCRENTYFIYRLGGETVPATKLDNGVVITLSTVPVTGNKRNHCILFRILRPTRFEVLWHTLAKTGTDPRLDMVMHELGNYLDAYHRRML